MAASCLLKKPEQANQEAVCRAAPGFARVCLKCKIS